jgi:hypothetical protein
MRFRPNRPRPGRRPPGGAVPRPVLIQLLEANRLAEAGYPAEAATHFIRLAKEAELRGAPRRSAHLHLQASLCLIRVPDGPNALYHAQAALALIKRAAPPGRAQKLGRRLVAELEAGDLHAEAQTLQNSLSGLPASPEGPEEPLAASPPRDRLPVRCPHCGAPVRSDDVEWIDDHSAECAYCGGVVQAAEM